MGANWCRLVYLAFGCWRLAVGFGEIGFVSRVWGCGRAVDWVRFVYLGVGCWLLAVGFGGIGFVSHILAVGYGSGKGGVTRGWNRGVI